MRMSRSCAHVRRSTRTATKSRTETVVEPNVLSADGALDRHAVDLWESLSQPAHELIDGLVFAERARFVRCPTVGRIPTPQLRRSPRRNRLNVAAAAIG